MQKYAKNYKKGRKYGKIWVKQPKNVVKQRNNFLKEVFEL